MSQDIRCAEKRILRQAYVLDFKAEKEEL